MENKENNSPELKKKSHWNIRPYLAIALTAFSDHTEYHFLLPDLPL